MYRLVYVNLYINQFHFTLPFLDNLCYDIKGDFGDNSNRLVGS